jgi:hypothetical protein
MATTDKADSSAQSGTDGTTPPKTGTTVSSKAAARKKSQQQQQKNQKSNPPNSKKKQQNIVKIKFEGIASGVSPMKGVVIARSNGDLTGQFRVFRKKLAGAAADDKAYGLDSAILDLVAKVKSDFVQPKPDPLIHSNIIDVVGADGAPTGERKLVCHDPIAKEQIDAEYNMDLKIQKSNWNQYERHYEGYFRTAIGNVEENILTYCRSDNRMASVESNKDLIGSLLILRSVCAQNNGGMKVDEEYRNLITIHAAVSWRQDPKVGDAAFADQIKDRYGSAIYTSGKFVFGQSVYDKVLTNYRTPMTFKEYMLLSDADQAPIDKIVKERTIARLIIKNSLNDRAREQLLETYSVNNNTCYPNTISEALSLLSTFKNQKPNGNKKADDVAVVSYHEATIEDDIDDNIDDIDDAVINDDDIVVNNEPDINEINDAIVSEDKGVTFNEHVMASIIAEATTNIDEDQFFGASFAQLQEVDDAYDDDEPDLVCCAHIVDANNNYELDDEGDEPLFVTEANSNAEERNERIAARRATISLQVNQVKDFELMIYHTAQRVLHVGGQNVSIFHYEPGRPDLISHKYNRNVPESIIDYSDALRFKFKRAGINDTTMLSLIMSSRTDTQVMTVLKDKFNAVGMKGINTSTVKILRQENERNIAHEKYNCLRYHNMELEIGIDAMMETFPRENTLLHHVVSAACINQNRRKPNRWVNKVTHKLINAGITSIELLQSKIESNNLNEHLDDRGMPRLHDITINGFTYILGTEDFRQGRF